MTQTTERPYVTTPTTELVKMISGDWHVIADLPGNRDWLMTEAALAMVAELTARHEADPKSIADQMYISETTADLVVQINDAWAGYVSLWGNELLRLGYELAFIEPMAAEISRRL